MKYRYLTLELVGDNGEANIVNRHCCQEGAAETWRRALQTAKQGQVPIVQIDLQTGQQLRSSEPALTRSKQLTIVKDSRFCPICDRPAEGFEEIPNGRRAVCQACNIAWVREGIRY